MPVSKKTHKKGRKKATKKSNVLVLGAFGQIGTMLVPKLIAQMGAAHVICVDRRVPERPLDCRFVKADVTNEKAIRTIVKRYKIGTIYHLAALLSVSGERQPHVAWEENMRGLKSVLDIAALAKCKVFWPSSIAAFGTTSPHKNTPQHVPLEPTTMYGITKVAGELLCQYYHDRFGLDVRSVRFPGVLSADMTPGGGTTDFAIDIFLHAAKGKPYICYLRKDTTLPMIHIDDAVDAALKIMRVPASRLSIRLGYNIAALSFSVAALAKEIAKHKKLSVSYKPDFRQAIADSWPQSISDTPARRDFGWKPKHTRLTDIVNLMFKELAALDSK